MHTVERYHDISAGHRVAGHENKCADLHGHNYRIHFVCTAESLDRVGRVIDFGVVKSTLCAWLEESWDHRFLLWEDDPGVSQMRDFRGVLVVPFNPTAENMAEYLVETVGPRLLQGTGVLLMSCTVDETRKCSATYTRVDCDNHGRRS